MIGTILTYRDYDLIIDHCKTCKGGFAIQDFIKNIFDGFKKDNSNLALNILERIELKFPSLQYYETLQEYDILDFQDQLGNLRNASIEYLYSYLILKILEQDHPDILHIHTEKEIVLKRILKDMKEKMFIFYHKVENVLWIFNKVYYKKSAEKLKWIDEAKNHAPNYQNLFFFLDTLCGRSIFQARRILLFIEIQKKFQTKKGDTFIPNNWKQNAFKYLNLSQKKLSSKQLEIKRIIGSF